VTAPVFHRYVALGDSFTEGVGDADSARPNGVRGWADRVAEVLARRTDDFGYANMAVRGRTLRLILEQQLESALALDPDLVTIYAGGNDLIRPRCDVDALGEVYDEAVGKLASTCSPPSTRVAVGRSHGCAAGSRSTTSGSARSPSDTAPSSWTRGGCGPSIPS
jgi:hypothetical protein